MGGGGGRERGMEEIATPAPPSLTVDAHAGPLLVQGIYSANKKGIFVFISRV